MQSLGATWYYSQPVIEDINVFVITVIKDLELRAQRLFSSPMDETV